MVCYDTQLTTIITSFASIKAGPACTTTHSSIRRRSSLLQTLQSFSPVVLSVPSTFLRSTAAATVMAPVGNPSLFVRFVSLGYRARQQQLIDSTTAPGLTGSVAALLVAVRPGGELSSLRSSGEYLPCCFAGACSPCTQTCLCCPWLSLTRPICACRVSHAALQPTHQSSTLRRPQILRECHQRWSRSVPAAFHVVLRSMPGCLQAFAIAQSLK
jgi:hypothetical protein